MQSEKFVSHEWPLTRKPVAVVPRGPTVSGLTSYGHLILDFELRLWPKTRNKDNVHLNVANYLPTMELSPS